MALLQVHVSLTLWTSAFLVCTHFTMCALTIIDPYM